MQDVREWNHNQEYEESFPAGVAVWPGRVWCMVDGYDKLIVSFTLFGLSILLMELAGCAVYPW